MHDSKFLPFERNVLDKISASVKTQAAGLDIGITVTFFL